jgi:hypothetical protein
MTSIKEDGALYNQFIGVAVFTSCINCLHVFRQRCWPHWNKEENI